jgi:hypothetical protein
MAKDRLSGKLAVILHADVVGSTSLVQQDEQKAHQRIQDSFRRFGDTISTYHGQVRELRAASDLCRLLRDQEARQEALDLLAPVYEWFTEGFETADLRAAKALLEELS